MVQESFVGSIQPVQGLQLPEEIRDVVTTLGAQAKNAATPVRTFPGDRTREIPTFDSMDRSRARSRAMMTRVPTPPAPSAITYTVPLGAEGAYELRAGCYSVATCLGSVGLRDQ